MRSPELIAHLSSNLVQERVQVLRLQQQLRHLELQTCQPTRHRSDRLSQLWLARRQRPAVRLVVRHKAVVPAVAVAVELPRQRLKRRRQRKLLQLQLQLRLQQQAELAVVERLAVVTQVAAATPVLVLHQHKRAQQRQRRADVLQLPVVGAVVAAA